MANHKHVFAVMRAPNLLVHIQHYCQATDSTHGFGRFPNLIRGLAIIRPDQVCCADITYVRLPREFVYLAVLLDVFTRESRTVTGFAIASHERRDIFTRTRDSR